MGLKGKWGTKFAVLAAVSIFALFCDGCGDVFRPVANPVFQPGGDPQRTRHALVVSSNGASSGAAVAIDVSGDDAVAIFSGANANGVDTGVGRNPVYATNLGGTDYVINRDDNSVSSFILPIPPNPLNPPALTALPNLSPALCPAVDPLPVFAAVAQNKLFVAESARNCIAVIDPGTGADTLEIPVGRNPVALVATPDGTRLYVLNKTDGTLTLIFPATNQAAASAIAVGAAPVWGVASTDGSRVFVVNQGDSTVSVIDTVTEAPIPSSPLPVGTGPNYIVYAATQNRAYVTSPADKSLSIIENATGAAPKVTVLSLAGTPCSGVPISVTALSNGTRAYVADQANNTVCVLDTTNNQFVRSIPVGATPVFIASDSDSTRVYTANSGSHDITVIETSTDTKVPVTICAGPPVLDALGHVMCPATFVPTFIAMTP